MSVSDDIINNLSNLKDINERQSIIDKYYRYGILDRDEAIRKIIELRITDFSVAAFYELQSTQPQIKLEEASDLQLIKELETQITILSGKYIDRNNIC